MKINYSREVAKANLRYDIVDYNHEDGILWIKNAVITINPDFNEGDYLLLHEMTHFYSLFHNEHFRKILAEKTKKRLSTIASMKENNLNYSDDILKKKIEDLFKKEVSLDDIIILWEIDDLIAEINSDKREPTEIK